MNYEAFIKIMVTSDHGVPQARRRLYLVAIRKDSYKHPFKIPEKIKLDQDAAARLLNTRLSDNPKALPPKEEKRARENVKKEYKKVLGQGIDPKKVFVAADGANQTCKIKMEKVNIYIYIYIIV